MVIGTGQLATVFKDSTLNDSLIFASGVSNSNCKKNSEFQREKALLLESLENNRDKNFIYFSSCALSSNDYPKNEYYRHKQKMEELIKENSNNYYIFRIPQLFGHLKSHKTLINFIYNCILDDEEFKLYSDAYRYVIEINDLKLLVEKYVAFSNSNIVVDLANNYKYKVLDIVEIFENLLNK